MRKRNKCVMFYLNVLLQVSIKYVQVWSKNIIKKKI